MTTPHLNLDTRRDIVSLTVDLNDSGPLVPVVAFDAPDDLRAPAKLALVSLEARASHRAAGWQMGTELVTEMTLEPKGRAVLSVSREWIAERVAVQRALGGADARSVIELPFSSILHLPRAPRASPRRVARISVAANASRPAVTLAPLELDLDNLPAAEADRVAQIAITLPPDLVFEANRSLIIETTCAGLPGESLGLAPQDVNAAEVSIRRLPGLPAAARHRLDIGRAEELAGQVLVLNLSLNRQTLLGVIDRLLGESQGKPAALRISARVSGWGDGSAPGADDQPDRRFVLAPPSVSCLAGSRNAQKLLAAIGDSTFPVGLDEESTTMVDGPALRFEADPDAPTEIVRFPGLKLGVLRWPLGRVGTVAIEAVARLDGENVAEPPVSLTPNIERERGQSRQAQTLLPLRRTITRLAQLARAGQMPAPGAMSVRLTFATNGREFLRAVLPIRVTRSVHRMPICIDLGASAISIWAGGPRGADQVFDMKPLPVGSWLAANVDPSHEEARTLDGDAAVLIPSHVSLDPANCLRSDHAPQTLAAARMIGPGRDAAKARMEHFGRRYDVSVPGPPPIMQGRAASRRVTGLKHALATGQQTIALAEQVNRYDHATGKVTPTSIIDVAPLVADVLDELVDLYVMRLGRDGIEVSESDPPPVAPRVVVTCPSGIGGEVQARYGAALAQFARRLDRLFPGASNFADAALPLPEAVAAARYVADALAPEIKVAPGEPAYLLTLDLGASTSDIAVSRLALQAGRLQKFETVSTFGIPVGGNAIDKALIKIIAPLADLVIAAPGSGWTPAFDAASVAKALASDEASSILAQQWVWNSLKQAKAQLTERLMAAGGDFRWSGDSGHTLDFVMAARGRDGVWRGLCQPAGEAETGAAGIAAGVSTIVETQPDGGMRLLLRISRGALEGEGDGQRELARVIAVLGVHLQRMARSVVPLAARRPKVFVAPTGRAALWPPLFEAMAAEAEKGRDSFPLKRPFSAAVMKKAVVAGAALLSDQTSGGSPAVELPCPLGLAVMGTHLSERADGTLRTGSVATRILYLSFDMRGRDRTFQAEDGEAPSLAARADLGTRFQFVRATPGLDPRGQMLSDLREVLGHQDPVVVLEGDITVDARSERIDRFGVCEVASTSTGPDRRRVVVTARDRDWEGAWDIEGDRVIRAY